MGSVGSYLASAHLADWELSPQAEIRAAIDYRTAEVDSGRAAPATPMAPGLTRPFPNTNELQLQARTKLVGSRPPSGYYSWLSFGGKTGALLDHPVLVQIRAANSRGPGGPTGPLGTPLRTPWILSRSGSAIRNALALVPGPLARL